jgi:hypothetical protein
MLWAEIVVKKRLYLTASEFISYSSFFFQNLKRSNRVGKPVSLQMRRKSPPQSPRSRGEAFFLWAEIVVKKEAVKYSL